MLCVLFYLSLSCVPNVASFSGLSIFDYPFSFSSLTFIIEAKTHALYVQRIQFLKFLQENGCFVVYKYVLVMNIAEIHCSLELYFNQPSGVYFSSPIWAECACQVLLSLGIRRLSFVLKL